MNQEFWTADPHRFGNGKIHAIDLENPSKTYCGKLLAVIPGKLSQSKIATCQQCVQIPIKREQGRKRQEQWQKEYEEKKAKEELEWRSFYNDYIKSEEWKNKRMLVIMRASGICEGCGTRKAAQVHHLSYEHLGNEFLWELRAVCIFCHEKAHIK